MLERLIYAQPDLSNECANIQIYVAPNCITAPTAAPTHTPTPTYTLYIKAISLNDGVFSMKIENVQSIYLEKACMHVFNVFHMNWMPVYVCQDMIDYKSVSSGFSSELFNSVLDTLTENEKFVYDMNILTTRG